MRTSAQCWCDDKDDCLANPAVRALTDRMLNVTRLPYNNAEYFQICLLYTSPSPRDLH